MTSERPSRRVQRLVDLLQRIASRDDVPHELLLRFQSVYQALPPEERDLLFEEIVRQLETSKQEIEQDLRRVLQADAEAAAAWSRKVTSLRRHLESPRLRALRRFLNISGGLRFLLDLRADVLAVERHNTSDVEPLSEELAHLLNTWFRHGFLFLQEITLDSPFFQIQFLKEHELVHPMASLEEMGQRLGADRRCFALYHRAMPDEPVVFIEVALTRGLAKSIHEIIVDGQGPASPPSSPDTAIFYSINNAQHGLTGLGLGKLLIFRVVDALKRHQPSIRTFATLSPMPGFWNRYLKPILEGDDAGFRLKRSELSGYFSDRAAAALLAHHAEATGKQAEDLGSALATLFSDPAWIDDADTADLLRRPLTDIGYFYLTEEENRRGKPLNPVAGFHLGNGARVRPGNIHFAANRSPRGLAESLGLMANYVYLSSWPKELRRTMAAMLPWRG